MTEPYLPIELLLVLAAAAVLTPLVLGLCTFVPATRCPAGVLLPWAATPALVLAVMSYGPAWGGLVPWLLVGSGVGLDLAGRVCLLCLGLTWTLSALSARPWHLHDTTSSRLAGLFLLAMAGHIGLTLSTDAISFCVCLAIMIGAAFGLMVHNGSSDSRIAGRRYLYIVAAGGFLLATGLVVAANNAGSFELAMLSRGMLNARSGLLAATAFLVAFGMLAGIAPMHGWLTVGLAAAPGATSAAMGAAFSLTATLGWLRFLPLGPVALPDWGLACLAAGVISVAYGVMQGFQQRSPAVLLGWSTVSQMGIVAMAIGMAFVAPGAAAALTVAAVVFAAHHALAKTALVLGAGAAVAGPWPAHTSRKLGIAILAVPVLVLAGAPLTSGAMSVAVLVRAFGVSGMRSVGTLTTLVSLALAAHTALMCRFLHLLVHQPLGQANAVTPWAWTCVAIATVVSLLSPWLVLRLAADPTPTITLATLWPVAAGVAVGAATIWIPRNRS